MKIDKYGEPWTATEEIETTLDRTPMHEKIINVLKDFEEKLTPLSHELAKVNAFLELKRGQEISLSCDSSAMKVEGLVRADILAALKVKSNEIHGEMDSLARSTMEALRSL